jgi:hypothetical protein
MPITAENGYVFVPRNEWDRDADYPRRPLRDGLNEVYIHHSVTPATDDPCRDARLVEAVLDSRGLEGYSFLVHPSGTVLELAGFDRMGEHTSGQNDHSIGICFIGNMQVDRPTLGSLVAAARTINLGKLGGHIAADMPVENILPHRAVKATACPGAHLLEPWINGRSGMDWIRWFVATSA